MIQQILCTWKFEVGTAFQQPHVFALSIQAKHLFPPRLELGTFRVLGERDNHYTTETQQ
jgi:hypothetical protein